MIVPNISVPSDVLVRIGGAGSVFIVDVKPHIGEIGEWYNLHTFASYEGWIEGTETQWSHVLVNVMHAEIHIMRSGTGEQICRVDGYANAADGFVVLEISQTSIKIRENGEVRFHVWLNLEPASTVVVTVSRTSGSESIVVQKGAKMAFEPIRRDAGQEVSLSQASDANSPSKEATLSASIEGGEDVTNETVAVGSGVGVNLAFASAGSVATAQTGSWSRTGQVNDGVHAVRTNDGWTAWTNLSAPGFMALDRQQALTVLRVRLLNWNWFRPIQRYQMELSRDKETWTILANASVNVREGGALFENPITGIPAGMAWTCGDKRLVGQSGVTFEFKSANWNVWRLVTGAQAADENRDNETAMFMLSMLGFSQDATVLAMALDGDIGETLALASRGTTIARKKAIRAVQLIDGLQALSLLNSELEVDSSPSPPQGQGQSLTLSREGSSISALTSGGPQNETDWLAVEVTEESRSDARILYSQDYEDWRSLSEDMEANPVALNFLCRLFPDNGAAAVSHVVDIWANPSGIRAVEEL